MSEEENKPLAWSETEIPALGLLPLRKSPFPEGVSPHAFADGDVAGALIPAFGMAGDVAGPLPSYQPSEKLLSAQARGALWKRLAKTLFHEGTEQWEVRNRKLQEENERLDDEVRSLTEDYSALADKHKGLEAEHAQLTAQLEDKAKVDAHDEKYVESLRKQIDDQRAAYEHKILVNTDLARKLEAAEKQLLAREDAAGQIIDAVRDESARASKQTVAEVKDLIGRLISFIASGAPELVKRKAEPPKGFEHLRKAVKEKFKDSPVRKAVLAKTKSVAKIKPSKKKAKEVKRTRR